MLELHEDLGNLGIKHNDIRHKNILFAPEAPLQILDSICPKHQKNHLYRIVDFDQANKSNSTEKTLTLKAYDILLGLWAAMKEGYTIEPEDYYEFFDE